jgi:hypothetical protein
MLLNLVFGLLTPWILSIFILIKDKKILLTIFPFMSMLSYTIISLEHDTKFWTLEPSKYNALPSIPYCIGLYPVNACYLIYLIRYTKINPYTLIFCFSIFTTLEEWIGFLVGKVQYHNGWNIFWTFISYLTPYILCVQYYRLLNKFKIFNTKGKFE